MQEEPTPLTRRVENYLKHRPTYPHALLELLEAECGLTPAHVVADIGMGPGNLAELFLRNGNAVFGVEPDPNMRAGAAYHLRAYPRLTSVDATAEATTLPDASVDVISAGQAFHWFDPERAREEFARILRPGGWVVIVWNIQRSSSTPFMEALNRFWKDDRFWINERAQSFGTPAWADGYGYARQAILEPFFHPGTFKEQRFDNPLPCDLEALKGRVFSTRPALAPEDSGYQAMIVALEQLFQQHEENGIVTIEHDLRVVCGCFQ